MFKQIVLIDPEFKTKSNSENMRIQSKKKTKNRGCSVCVVLCCVILLVIQALDQRNFGSNNGERTGRESSASLEKRLV